MLTRPWPNRCASSSRPLSSEQSRVKTRRRTSRQKSNRTRLKLQTATWLIIIIIQLALDSLLVAAQATSRTKREISPAVVLPKLGLIRGLKFQPSASNKGQPAAVAAFLGVPYAAPPTGPLRFMPPGAVRPSQTRAPNGGEQCLLLPGRNAAHSRQFVKFGHECVQLASWLPPRPASATDLAQSEDCLNLNLFVPYEPRNLRDSIKRTPSNELDDPSTALLASRELVAQIPANDTGDHDRFPRLRPTRSDPDPTPNDKSISPNESAQEHPDDKAHCFLDQINANQQRLRQKPLPVMVVFHSNRDQNRPPNKFERLPDGDKQQRDNKANSLTFVEVAQRTQSIVVTFNYRIGLLGYLPYIDQMDQFQHSASSPSARSDEQARYNHAIWDQLGLLHWLRHNIANFNGDPSNLTLVSADNLAAKHIQLLAMSPISKGLFARLALVHDQGQDKDELKEGNGSLDRLLELATKSREMKRKLINEMSLLVRKLKIQNATSIDGNNNIELDRYMFQFLKNANLSELASFESRLAELKLIEFISEPNLNDRMLFPFFAQLIKMKQVVEMNSLLGDTNATSGRQSAVGDNVENMFWSALRLMPDRLAPNDSFQGPLASSSSNRVELDYCLYLGQLYEAILKLDAEKKLLNVHDLDEIDPFKLVPRVSERTIQMATKSLASVKTADSHNQRLIQKSSPSPWLSPWSWFRNSPSAGEAGEAESNVDTTGRRSELPKGNWTQSRLVSAAEFYHLRNAHLLNQLLVQKLNALAQTLEQSNSDEEDEEDENLLSKQQRSLMLMSQHQQNSIGNANPRAKRDTILDQFTVLGDQLMELMSSYDLLIGFIGKPVRPSTKQHQRHQTRANDSSAIISSLRNMTERSSQLDSELSFWLKVADSHFVSHALKANGHHLTTEGQLRGYPLASSCDFISDKIQRIKQRTGETESTSGRAQDIRTTAERSTYVFLSNEKSTFGLDSDENDWISEGNGDILAPLTSFLHSSAYKVPSETQMDETWTPYDTMSRHINLPLGPLSNETKTSLETHINVHFNLIPYLEQHSMVSLKLKSDRDQIGPSGNFAHRMLAPPRELSSCLNDLESKLEQSGSLAESNELLTRAKFSNDLHCLSHEVARLRGQLRAGAAKELEPLVVQFLTALAASRSNASEPLARNYTHQLNDKQLALISQNQRVTSMTTRNLVNHSEGMFLDQFEASGMNVGLNDQSGSEMRTANAASSSPANSRPTSDQSAPRANQAANSTASGIRGFFAKTYKDAVGQALGIVIGTGALIFLLNLVIVLVIALRSARHNRKAEGKRRTCAAVRDVNQMEYLRTSSNVPPAELLQRDYQISQMNSIKTNGFNSDQGNLLAEGKQLTSSFKQQSDTFIGEKTRKRSMKSIKFNLSGVDGQAEDSQRYRENELDGVPYSSKQNAEPPTYPKKNCQLHPEEAKIDAKPFGNRDQQQDQQQMQLTSSSPSYLLNEFSDEIELDQMSPDEDERQFQNYIASNGVMHLDGMPIYVTHQHQMADLQGDGSSSNLACRMHQNQQRFRRSLGSSSLTSPFASQATPSTNTSSNSTAIYTIQAADPNPVSKMSLMQSLVPDSNQSEMFLANQQNLYSASSSTVSAETPIRPPQRTVSMIVQQTGQHQTSCAYHQIQSDSMKRNSSLRLAGSQGNLVAQDQANSYIIYAPQSSKHSTHNYADEQQEENFSQQESVQLLIMPTSNDQNYQAAHRYQ